MGHIKDVKYQGILVTEIEKGRVVVNFYGAGYQGETRFKEDVARASGGIFKGWYAVPGKPSELLEMVEDRV